MDSKKIDNIQRLLASLAKDCEMLTVADAAAEVELMDEFIKQHAKMYQLLVINYDAPFERSMFKKELLGMSQEMQNANLNHLYMTLVN